VSAVGNPERPPAPDAEREPKIVVRDRRRVDPATGSPRAASSSGSGSGSAETAQSGAAPTTGSGSSSINNSDLTALHTQLAERTNDLQRITAEYANYRKRMERERVAVVEHATATLLTTLLPVLDDIERARSHGDLEGAFGSVAEQLFATLHKSGLRAFGEVGEPFDPSRHEAVTHSFSEDVTEPTCTQVPRRGYALGELLLRTALVAVTEPPASSGEDSPSAAQPLETVSEPGQS